MAGLHDEVPSELAKWTQNHLPSSYIEDEKLSATIFEESCRVIERKAGEDKREVQIILTDKGKDLLNEGVSLIEDVLSHYQLDKMEIIIEK